MDITDALAPKSDQLDAVELVAPRTFTIDDGSRLGRRDDDGQAVVEVRLVNFPRVWRPSKGMLDALVAIWGTKVKEWAGRQVTLYNDRDVTFGKDKVGGIRISHMSGIDKTTTVQIRGRGRGARKLPWRVEPIAAPQADPLKEAKSRLWQAWLAAGNAHSGDALTAEYEQWAAANIDDATAEQLDAFADTLTTGEVAEGQA